MDFPVVTIMVITYKRLNEIQQTLDALRKHISYPADKLRWLIADDSSGADYIESIKALKRFKALNLEFAVTPANGGWGRNVNHALSQIETEYVFQIEDDYLLRKPLDLRAGIALMETKPEIGMLRYRGIAGTHMVTHLMEADISAYLPDHQDGVHMVPGKLQYCLLDSGSPTAYIYSNGAHLKRRSFHQFYGVYPEGQKLGATEETFCYTVKSAMKLPNAPAIAILPDWFYMWFEHIGQSYQLTEEDRGERHMMGAAPYSKITGVPGWETEHEQNLLLTLARKVPPGGVIVEIGSEWGMSASLLCYGSQQRNIAVHCVDLFPNDYRGDMMAHHAHNLRTAGFGDRVIYHRGDSGNVGEFWDGAIDLLFIDGDHSFNGVSRDINAWCGHIKVGGIVIFHDTAAKSNTNIHTLHIEVSQAIDAWQKQDGAHWRELPSVDSMRVFERIE